LKIVGDPAAMRSESSEARSLGRTIGFVPTMGSLHEGHLSLVRRCRASGSVTVASIFVNPAQFSPGEDFERYPRDPDRDARLLEKEGVDILFLPEASDLYRPGHSTWVDVTGLTRGLCAAHRPGHFRGVATIVAKLLNLVRPDAAYFGQKDAQQAAIIRRMVEDLDFDTRVVVCPTVREPDGLALSSRNVFLSPEHRLAAPSLYAALEAGRRAVASGERDAGRLRSMMTERLQGAGFRPQYVDAVGATSLEPVDPLDGEVLLAAAAYLGATRLIDNVTLTVPAGTVARS
jgi:pantoate--beta-alanine ligase